MQTDKDHLPETDDDFLGNEIAIIGMACRVPGANNPNQFWHNIRHGVESVRYYTDEELEQAGVSEKQRNHPQYVKAGAPLDLLEQFDPKFFKMGPREAQIMDPQHRQFLECSWEALENAAVDPANFEGLIGVFGGSGHNAYFPYNILTNQELLNSEGFFLLRHTGNDKDFLTTRVSYTLNLKGPSINVQTACSTSLVAVHMAAQSLIQKECDMALAGGVTLELPHRQGYLYHENEILSPDGRCRPFSADSAGTIFGSGVGVVVLRRLSDALADNDPILAVILGSAVNNDGIEKSSYLAPSPEGQSLVISEALEIADIDADTIGYVEAHGTGTQLGDPIELQGLTQAFRHTTDKQQFCGIGSVKSNIGHLDTAAGVISLIKAVQALRHKELPPSLNFSAPNPMIDWAQSPFYVNHRLQDWPKPADFPRRAGVSSLGVGGTNAHLIVQESTSRPNSTRSARRFHLLTLSAKTPTALDSNSQRFASYLTTYPDSHTADVAYTTQIGRRAFTQRKVVVGRNADDLAQALRQPDRQQSATQKATTENPGIVFMFSGGGTQHPDMGRDLYEYESVYRNTIDRCLAFIKKEHQLDLRPYLFPTPDFKDEAARTLQRPSYSLPAIFITEYALAQLWQSWGIKSDSMIGHSMGEYTAACLAGVFTVEKGISIVIKRGHLFETLAEGRMLSVSMLEKDLQPLLPKGTAIAAINNPEICVVSGEIAAIENLETMLEARQVSTQRIRINVAAHSPMLEPILNSFGAYMRTVPLQAPQTKYVSNVTGTWITSKEATDPQYWVNHLRHTVRFAAGLETLLAGETPKVLVEVGPGQVMTGLARVHPHKQIHHTAVASMRHFRDQTADDQHMLLALGKIWAAGYPVSWDTFYGDEVRQRLHLPTYAFDHAPYWIEPGKELFTVESGIRSGLNKTADPLEWFYHFNWHHEGRITPPNHPPKPQTWLIFADNLGVSDQLTEQLRGSQQVVITVKHGREFQQNGRQQYTIQPDAPDHYAQLLQSLKERNLLPQQIIHSWAIYHSTPIPAGEEYSHFTYGDIFVFGFSSLLYLAQAWGEQEAEQELWLTVLANGTQKIGREGVLCPEKAILLGPSQVIPREYPQIKSRFIDLDLPKATTQPSWLFRKKPQIDQSILNPLAEQLSLELLHRNDSGVFAYRDTGRWVRKIKHSPIEPANMSVHMRLRKRGVYLITGGFGGIGHTIASYLAETYKAQLALTGRNPLPPRAQWSEWLENHPPNQPISRIIKQIKHLEQLGGDVLYLTADVTNESNVFDAVSNLYQHYPTLDGVIHAAGVIDDDLIQLKKIERAERVINPKVLGTIYLHDALSKQELDFFILFSSTSTILAPAGQVDYVGANAFLNSFAEQQQAANSPLNVLALNWGVWQNVGMAATAVRGEGDRLYGWAMRHPFLGQKVYADGKTVRYAADYRADEYWFLDQHRIRQGDAVLPGTGYLELAAAALHQDNGRTPIEIQDFFFLSPLSVATGETKRVYISTEAHEFADEHTITINSEVGQNQQEHARGSIGRLNEAPPPPINITEIGYRCNGPAVHFNPFAQDTKQERYLNFGLRWKNLRSIYYGHQESLARLELPLQFYADLDSFFLHPALLDLATTHGLPLLEGYTQTDGVYVPFSYRSLKAYAPLAARIHSHARLHPTSTLDLPTFDITIADPNGRVLVEILEFTMKRVPHQDMLPSVQTAPITETKTFLEQTIESGIKPEEGVEALSHLLAYRMPTQVIISSIPVKALQEAMEAEQQQNKAQNNGLSSERPTNLSSPYQEPTTDLEKSLAADWEELLGIRPIGIHDDFFELGGHSLIAVRFFTRLKKRHKIDLSLSTLFETATIAQYAERLSPRLTKSDAPADTSTPKQPELINDGLLLVPITPQTAGNQNNPFFCVHGAGGNVLNFYTLAQHLGPQHPFYALQAQGVDGIQKPVNSITEMAANYIEAIREVQPSGPYQLGGYSGGGVVAYEMAQQLIASGEEIRVILMLDTFHPAVNARSIPRQEHLRQIQKKGLFYIRERLTKRKIRQEKAKCHEASLAFIANHQHQDGPIPFEHREPYLVHSFLGAVQQYEPQPYTGRVIQFSASDTWIMYQHAGPDRGWIDLLPNLEVRRTPGDHEHLFNEPNVQVLAQQLLTILS